MSPCARDKFRIIYDQVRWTERYLYEIICISKRPTLELNKKSHYASTAVAPDFFRMLYGLLFDAAILEAAKLLDPPKQLGHENICLESVIQGAGWLNDETRKKTHRTLSDIRKKYSKKIKHSRNKFLAHADDRAVTERTEPATYGDHISLDELHNAISCIRTLVGTICPSDISMPPFPSDDKNWLGVSVILERLEVILMPLSGSIRSDMGKAVHDWDPCGHHTDSQSEP